jgi:hypothetical protein
MGGLSYGASLGRVRCQLPSNILLVDSSLLISPVSLGAFFVSHKKGLIGGRLGNGGAIAVFFVVSFWYFWLTIQNTTNRHVSKAFGLLAKFISFLLVRAAAAAAAADFRFFGGGEGSTQK